MIVFVFAILAVVAAYFFYKHYDAIDSALFGKGNPDYVPFGKMPILSAAIATAILGAIQLIGGDAIKPYDTTINIIAGVLALAVYGFAVYQIVKNIQDIKMRIYKSLFMLVACAFFAFVGISAVLLVALALMLYIILLILRIFVFGGNSAGGKRIKLRDEDGNEVEGKEGFGGDVYGNDGKVYEKNNDIIDTMLGVDKYREK